MIHIPKTTVEVKHRGAWFTVARYAPNIEYASTSILKNTTGRSRVQGLDAYNENHFLWETEVVVLTLWNLKLFLKHFYASVDF